MTPRKDDPIEALFIVAWYASSLRDVAPTGDSKREETMLEVVELLEASRLSKATKDAVLRVVLEVARLDLSARRFHKAAARERKARAIVAVGAGLVAAAALWFRLEQAFALAFMCFVASVAPRCAAFVFERTKPRKDD